MVLCSPYVRARETARLMLEGAGIAQDGLRLRVDERLREKEFGILDRLTHFGIRQKYPELGDQRVARRQVLFPPARRRKLVRRDPAAAQPAGDDDARARRRSAC